MSDESRVYLVKKHPRWIRWCHWLHFPLLSLMVWSGILIYWANSVYWPFFPQWFYRAFHLEYRLAFGMAVHFTTMWLFTLNGILYVGYLVYSGEWRELFPETMGWEPAFKDAWRVLLHELGIVKVAPVKTGKFNAAQRIAYAGIIFIGVGSVLSGIAIYKPVQFNLLTRLFLGYEGARLFHFVFMLAYVAFFIIHITQVVRAGWNNLRSMLTGYEKDENSF